MGHYFSFRNILTLHPLREEGILGNVSPDFFISCGNGEEMPDALIAQAVGVGIAGEDVIRKIVVQIPHPVFIRRVGDDPAHIRQIA